MMTMRHQKNFKDVSFEFDLVQNALQPKHNKGNILDLMISNTSAILKDVDIDETTPSVYLIFTCLLESIVICNKKR